MTRQTIAVQADLCLTTVLSNQLPSQTRAQKDLEVISLKSKYPQ